MGILLYLHVTTKQDIMTFSEYLNKDDDDFNAVSEYYINFLNDFAAKGFMYEEQLKLKGATDKFINSAFQLSYQNKAERELVAGLVSTLIKSCRYYRRVNSKPVFLFFYKIFKYKALERVQEAFEVLYSKSIDIINHVTTSYLYKYAGSDLDLNGFYQPKNINKEEVKRLIRESIQLIIDDDSLSEKSKTQIIKYLNKVISKLEYDYVSWTSILGHIKEAIIVLGALGSFVGGYCALRKAEGKLEETTKLIQQNSITINYKIVNETFKINNIPQLNEFSEKILQKGSDGDLLE